MRTTARLIAAVPLGYAATAMAAAATARLLPGDAAQATLTAMLLSYALYAALVVYVFADRRAWRPLLVTAAIALVGATIAYPSLTRPVMP